MPLAASDIKVGFAFYWKAPNSPEPHLHFVLAVAKPPDDDHCVLVNVTSGSGGEKAYKMPKAHHSALKYDSEVNLADGLVASRAEIAAQIKTGDVQQRFSMDVLRPMGLEAKKHGGLSDKARDIMGKQWVG